MAEDVFQDFIRVTNDLKNGQGGLIDSYVILVLTEEGQPSSQIATYSAPLSSEHPTTILARAFALRIKEAMNRGASEREAWAVFMGKIAEHLFTLKKVT